MNVGTQTPLSYGLLSVVTIHLNDFEGLGRTLRSLEPHLAAGGLDWVVVDGESDRGTAEQAEVLDAARNSAAAFVSEPDAGIYHAMNKGTRMAQGGFVLYLNAGDELQPGFEFGRFLAAARGEPGMIWGNCTERYQGGQLVPIKTRSARWAWYGMPACHPAIFFNRRILGPEPYDTGFSIAADYDLVCRLLKSGSEVVMLDHPVSVFHRGGVSDARSRLTRSEENQVRMKYFSVPGPVGAALRTFKAMNRQLSKIAWFRRLWRSRV